MISLFVFQSSQDGVLTLDRGKCYDVNRGKATTTKLVVALLWQ